MAKKDKKVEVPNRVDSDALLAINRKLVAAQRMRAIQVQRVAKAYEALEAQQAKSQAAADKVSKIMAEYLEALKEQSVKVNGSEPSQS